MVWLDFADGTLERHQVELSERIAEVLAAERPQVVATFGPDGVTGHPDHVAVSMATSRAFHQVRASVGPGLRRLVYSAISKSDIDRWNVNRRLAGEFEWDPSAPFHIRGVADEMIGISVDTRRVASRTVEALRRHRSQWSMALVPIADDTLARSLQTEDWVIAWPPGAPDAQRLATLFEGLD